MPISWTRATRFPAEVGCPQRRTWRDSKSPLLTTSSSVAPRATSCGLRSTDRRLKDDYPLGWVAVLRAAPRKWVTLEASRHQHGISDRAETAAGVVCDQHGRGACRQPGAADLPLLGRYDRQDRHSAPSRPITGEICRARLPAGPFHVGQHHDSGPLFRRDQKCRAGALLPPV